VGLFKNLKAQVKGATDMAGEVRAGAPPVSGGLTTVGGQSAATEVTEGPEAFQETYGGGADPRPYVGVTSRDPLTASIEGVSWEKFIAVRAEIMARPESERFDAVAQRHGIQPGAFARINAAWMERIMEAPELAHRWGYDLDAAQRALKKG